MEALGQLLVGDKNLDADMFDYYCIFVRPLSRYKIQKREFNRKASGLLNRIIDWIGQ